MARGIVGRRFLGLIIVVGLLGLAACAPAAAPAAPTAAPAAPTAAPAAQPTKPAAQPAAQPTAAPAAQPTKPAAEPTKPAAAQQITLQAGANTPQGGSEADAIDHFAEVVAKKSNGAIKIVNHYTALGVEQQLAQAVQSGSVDIGVMSTGNAARWTTALMIYDLPFLFKKYDLALDTMESAAGRPLLQQWEKDLSLKFLFVASYSSGRHLQTRDKMAKTPADIKGMKIRVVSTPVDLAIFKAWGANPTPVDWGQTYAALQQKVVDGEQIAINNMYAAKHHEVVKYTTYLDYQPLCEWVFINPNKFASLSPQNQQILLDAAKETGPWTRVHEKEKLDTTLGKLKAEGHTVYYPTPAEYAEWTAVREQVWEQVGKEWQGKVDLEFAKKLYASQP